MNLPQSAQRNTRKVRRAQIAWIFPAKKMRTVAKILTRKKTPVVYSLRSLRAFLRVLRDGLPQASQTTNYYN